MKKPEVEETRAIFIEFKTKQIESTPSIKSGSGLEENINTERTKKVQEENSEKSPQDLELLSPRSQNGADLLPKITGKIHKNHLKKMTSLININNL